MEPETLLSVWANRSAVSKRPPSRAFRISSSTDFCPATNIGDLLAHNCSTIILLDGRLRFYNEVFIILVGLVGFSVFSKFKPESKPD